MPPITAITSCGLGEGLQPRVGLGHTDHQLGHQPPNDIGISFLELLRDCLPKTPVFGGLFELTHDVASEPDLPNHLHRRDPTGTKIGLTIGLTVLFLGCLWFFCVFSRSKKKEKKQKRSEDRSGSGRSTRHSSFHITDHIIFYQEESIRSKERKKKRSSRHRSRSRSRGGGHSHSRVEPEIFIAPPEPVHRRGSIPNAMDAPQDHTQMGDCEFAACDYQRCSKSKTRKAGRKGKSRG